MMAETELWLVDLDRTEAALETLEAATPRLSADTHQRLDAMADEAARRERRLAHIALRILLERRLGHGMRGTPFVRSATGKPSLPGHGIVFSLAHAGGLALIGLAERDPLGVDLERRHPDRVPDARRAPIEAEAVALAAGVPLAGDHPDARFLQAWVRIEAAAKALGHGVGAILERLRPGGPEPLVPAHHRPQIDVHDVAIAEDVYAAIALPAGLEPPPPGAFPDTAAGIDDLLGRQSGTRR
jgi:4'-phosphopantetheinyl transferase